MNQTLRTFALHPEANGAGEAWNLIATTNAKDETVARFPGRRLERNRNALTNAITTSKHPRTSIVTDSQGSDPANRGRRRKARTYIPGNGTHQPNQTVPTRSGTGSIR